MRSALRHLYIVRHGETVWNAEGRLQGQLDIALNSEGQAQARAFASVLEKLGLVGQVDAIVSSDLSRASLTADLIAEVCPQARRSHHDARLREVCCGSLQGMQRDSTRKVQMEIYSQWSRGNFAASFPQGESVAEVIARGLLALREAAELGSHVVVVTHAGLIKWCAVGLALTGGDPAWLPDSAAPQQRMAGANMRQLLQAPVRNCSCSVLAWDANSGRFQEGRWFEDWVGETLDDTG